jgi:hypothetical protein
MVDKDVGDGRARHPLDIVVSVPPRSAESFGDQARGSALSRSWWTHKD